MIKEEFNSTEEWEWYQSHEERLSLWNRLNRCEAAIQEISKFEEEFTYIGNIHMHAEKIIDDLQEEIGELYESASNVEDYAFSLVINHLMCEWEDGTEELWVKRYQAKSRQEELWMNTPLYEIGCNLYKMPDCELSGNVHSNLYKQESEAFGENQGYVPLDFLERHREVICHIVAYGKLVRKIDLPERKPHPLKENENGTA